ncbi:hypothetical protein FA13DRAFT_1794758 [Coprinellus micaceus]|uniref:Uncharacterized protein n=1 Tax=Coprinellus micaceus TaxID=71717 RepID=A0A4Y7T0H5_COPMI|nr:hypothetical protein FA13DRAFT_1794758 [Coprinellus micaceus]
MNQVLSICLYDPVDLPSLVRAHEEVMNSGDPVLYTLDRMPFDSWDFKIVHPMLPSPLRPLLGRHMYNPSPWSGLVQVYRSLQTVTSRAGFLLDWNPVSLLDDPIIVFNTVDTSLFMTQEERIEQVHHVNLAYALWLWAYYYIYIIEHSRMGP